MKNVIQFYGKTATVACGMNIVELTQTDIRKIAEEYEILTVIEDLKSKSADTTVYDDEAYREMAKEVLVRETECLSQSDIYWDIVDDVLRGVVPKTGYCYEVMSENDAVLENDFTELGEAIAYVFMVN